MHIYCDYIILILLLIGGDASLSLPLFSLRSFALINGDLPSSVSENDSMDEQTDSLSNLDDFTGDFLDASMKNNGNEGN